jgi:hypothetical protein
MARTGQVSVELLILLGLVFIIFVSIFSLVPDRDRHASQQVLKLSAQSLADKVAGGINSVHRAGDGAVIQVLLPTTLVEGTPYNITIYPTHHRVEIRWDGVDAHQYSAGIVTGNVTGNITARRGTIVMHQIKGGVHFP